MPLIGWQENATDRLLEENVVTLEYQKENRTATVVLTQIPYFGQTTVVITIDDHGGNIE